MVKDNYLAKKIIFLDENKTNPACRCGREFSVFEFSDYVFELLSRSDSALVVPENVSKGRNYIYICLHCSKPIPVINYV
jgi:DNA-directed RNA polymerase subunit RPC12/RpoP